MLNKLSEIIYELNSVKGWHDHPQHFGNFIALVHSELSEALEEYRKFGLEKPIYYEIDKNGNAKPEGYATELADVIIRVLDYCGEFNINIEEVLNEKLRYNQTREFRHGNKII